MEIGDDLKHGEPRNKMRHSNSKTFGRSRASAKFSSALNNSRRFDPGIDSKLRQATCRDYTSPVMTRNRFSSRCDLLETPLYLGATHWIRHAVF